MMVCLIVNTTIILKPTDHDLGIIDQFEGLIPSVYSLLK